KVKYYNPLKFTSIKHGKARPEWSRRVDDRPYGGGPGMVMQIEPILKAIQAARISAKGGSASGGKREKVKMILFSAGGKQLKSASASRMAKNYKHFILICGRYEGVDERVKRILKNQKLRIEELSVGPYVLTGGELPAMIFIDTASRQIKGVLGKEESLEEKRLGVGVPAYTRPEIFTYRGKKYRVPKVLLSGNHAKILEWRKKHRKLTRG
ncbi:MAG: hypothetical protein WD889_01075, partial [Candidatus Colwellbacteria bacterium]